jgi:hypothetical protein
MAGGDHPKIQNDYPLEGRRQAIEEYTAIPAVTAICRFLSWVANMQMFVL